MKRIPLPIYSTRNRRKRHSVPLEHWVAWAVIIGLSLWAWAWVVTTLVMNIQQVLK